MSTVLPVSNRLYIDSTVLVYHEFKNFKPTFSQRSEELLSKIERGKYEGIVSILSIMELVKSIRGLLTECNNCDKNAWREATRSAIEAIYKIKNIQIIEGDPTERKTSSQIEDLLYSTFIWKGFEILNKYPGKPGKSKSINHDFEHDGLSPVDTLHITLAQKMSCSKIATFDHDFKESRGEIMPLMLQEDIY
jgi:predicted nucleic acid-binding protein